MHHINEPFFALKRFLNVARAQAPWRGKMRITEHKREKLAGEASQVMGSTLSMRSPCYSLFSPLRSDKHQFSPDIGIT